MLPENTTNHLYKFATSLLFSGSSSLRRLRCWPTSWCGTCPRLSRGRSTGTCCFTASSSQCRRWVRCHPLCCSRLECALTSLTTRSHRLAVLSRAILGSHHVHQQGPERERLCHCLSYVSAPVWSESIFATGAAVVVAELPFCVSLRHDSGGVGNSSGHRNPGTDRRRRSWLPHGARCHRRRKRNHKYDDSSFGGNSECFAVCVSQGINSSQLQPLHDGPSWRCLPLPRNKPTWLLQGSSALSTSSAPLCCISGWRSKKVWSSSTRRELSFVHSHFQNCLVSSFRTHIWSEIKPDKLSVLPLLCDFFFQCKKTAKYNTYNKKNLFFNKLLRVLKGTTFRTSWTFWILAA